MPKNDKRRQDIKDQLAASIYKQGELQLAKNDKQGTIDQLLRLAQTVPDSSYRVNAQYDAATYLLDLKNYTKAIEVLVDFKRRFPKSPLAKDVPAKLVLAYQETKQPEKAAKELMFIAANAKTREERRQAQYLAGETYEKAGLIPNAIFNFRRYINQYPEPFDTAMEVRFKMSEFYVKTNEPKKREFWLKELIKNDAEAGAKRTDRSRYLAAFSSNYFAKGVMDRLQQNTPEATSKRQPKKEKTGPRQSA